MSLLDKYKLYLNHRNISEKYKNELLSMSDTEKEDCFYKDIEFGTISDQVRDKDALQATYILAEAANYYKKCENKSLIDVLDDIYSEYGYYHDEIETFILKGKTGQEKIVSIMESLREDELKEIAGVDVLDIEDYSKGMNNLPKANVLKYRLNDGSFITFRPSGTESKFKVYLSIRGESKDVAVDKYTNLVKEINKLIN